MLLADPATGEVAVWTYGHRNVQGLAVRPGTDQIFSVEQGTCRDDEVNLLRAGGNYGYDPDGADGGYDESVPDDRPGHPGRDPGGVVLRARRRSPPAAARSSTASSGAATTA